MLRMRDTRVCPPGGWQFVEPTTGWNNRIESAESLWDFKILCRDIQRYRRSHPELKLPIDPEEIRLEVDRANARRVATMDGGMIHVFDDTPPPPISRVFRPQRNNRPTILVRRSMALGDVLAATCVAKKLAEQGYGVQFQSIPAAHCMLARVPYLLGVEEPRVRAPDVNLDGAYEHHGGRHQTNFSHIFIEAANSQLAHRNILLADTNCCPRMELEDHDRDSVTPLLLRYPRPWVMICPKSNAWNHRTVPEHIWREVARQTIGTKFWLGMDPIEDRNLVDLGCRHFDTAIKYISNGDLMISVDTGPMHVAAALRIPTIAILQSSSPEVHLSDQQDYLMVQPPLDCLNCQQNTCPKDAHNPPCQNIPPQVVSAAANARLQTATMDGVSAIIPIYRPVMERLNRCLACVLPQVDEVVVTMERGVTVPPGTLSHPKIKFVKKDAEGIGVGRNFNFGVRHSNHKWLLFLNDDVYLEPDVVAKLRAVADGSTGMVAHLLRYPDGRIEHGGTMRSPGAMGWGHIDHFCRDHTIKEPREMENVCGASVLVRREAFYDAGCFDEDIKFYCEDNMLCLAMRHRRWKIMYNPHAVGVHEGHQSTRHVPEITKMMNESCKILEKKWGWYLQENPNADLSVHP